MPTKRKKIRFRAFVYVVEYQPHYIPKYRTITKKKGADCIQKSKTTEDVDSYKHKPTTKKQ